MKSPFTNKEMILRKEKSSLIFRNKEFDYVFHYYYCEDTEEKITTTELDELNINQVYNQYRDLHNIPFPDEIYQLRDKYEISANKMSLILGLGPNGYRHYEKGEVPSLVIANLIQSILGNHNVLKQLIERNKDLKDSEKSKYLDRIDFVESTEKDKIYDIEKYLNYYHGENIPCSMNGYKKTDINKLSEMVLFFTEKLQPTVTAMNKLLFYSDFLNYKKTAYSISGSTYMAHNYGPVPIKYRTIYEYMCDQSMVELIGEDYGNGIIGEKFTLTKFKSFNSELFNSLEIENLTQIADTFRGMSASQIKEISHKEKAWIENEKSKSLIDYNYSFELLDL